MSGRWDESKDKTILYMSRDKFRNFMVLFGSIGVISGYLFSWGVGC